MRKKAKKEFDEATRASAKKEMPKPRIARFAREEEVNRAAECRWRAAVRERSSTRA
jgi:hypothetical protein